MTWQDEIDDEEWVDDESDEDDVLLECPNCRGGVHEDTQQCPHCHEWITPMDRSGHWKLWVWAAAALLLILALSGVLLL